MTNYAQVCRITTKKQIESQIELIGVIASFLALSNYLVEGNKSKNTVKTKKRGQRT